MKNYILLLFLGITGSLNAQEIKLNVFYVKQQETEWCSAAAAKCILDYYGKKLDGKPITQCNIMDYVRTIRPDWYGPICCPKPENVFQYKCNKGVDLGVFNEKASVKGILMHFGELPCEKPQLGNILFPQNIRDNLTQDLLMVAQWNYNNPSFGDPEAHTVVIHGIKDWNLVYYMDPAPQNGEIGGGLKDLSWADFNNNAEHWWAQTLELTDCSGRDYPCHCYNGEKDEDEQGIDCGGSCPECAPPGCFNCQKDPDEEEMDCGGPNCPPCEDVPEERTITNTSQLRAENMAFTKITASGSTTVASGKTVSFITEEEGTIVLLPGFKAEKGSHFTTQRRDLSGSGRICGTICGKWWIPSSCYSFGDNRGLYIYDLQYANKIEYEIFTLNDSYHKSYVKDISHNGTVFLWNPPFYLENITYRILYDTYHCDNSKRRGGRDFTVIGWDNRGKSSNEESEEAENLDTPQFSSSDNLKIQDEMSAPAFSIIPNPNSGTFQIETNFPLSDIANLKVVNTLGIAVYKTQELLTHTIQLQDAASGMFFVVVFLKDGTMLTQKMMVQR